ncbi:MAG: tetratricopeptide repeat protein [Fibrobacter sp.]|jgi:tetratricopeptide (TPR) repeat protein|nr:tetratricopeptide repeat protein [Fibrobacter sp.]
MKWTLFGILTVSAGILLSGCNLFNATGGAKPSSGNADALILEGQISYRNEKYKEAAGYFKKALRADSTKSEAWFGLAKSVLYVNDVNPLTLISHVNISKNEIPFMRADKETVIQFYEGMKAAVFPLRELIRRDSITQNGSKRLSDQKIKTDHFSASYAVIEVSYSLLRFRYRNLNSNAFLWLHPNTKELEIFLDSLKHNPEYQKELAESLKDLAGDIVNLKGIVIPMVTDYVNANFTDSLEASLIHQNIEEMLNENIDDLGTAIDQYIEEHLNTPAIPAGKEEKTGEV